MDAHVHVALGVSLLLLIKRSATVGLNKGLQLLPLFHQLSLTIRFHGPIMELNKVPEESRVLIIYTGCSQCCLSSVTQF